jgi:hypothetical protein
MARAAVLVLALANLGYFAWGTGALAAFGLVPADLAAREPHRLARQIVPERLRVLTPQQVQAEAEARARARAEAEAQARLRAETREIRTTASATLAGSDTVIGVSEPAVLSVRPAPPGPSDRSTSPAPSVPPASAASASASASSSASARASEPSRPAAGPR